MMVHFLIGIFSLCPHIAEGGTEASSGLFVFFCFVFLNNLIFAACRLSLVVSSGGLLFVMVCRLLIWWYLLLQNADLRLQTSVVMAHGLSSRSSQALEHRFSSCGACSEACAVFPEQELNLCLFLLAGRFLSTELPWKSSQPSLIRALILFTRVPTLVI